MLISSIKLFLLLFIFALLPVNANAQVSVTIPAYTAYAIPVEDSNEDGESNMFSKKKGIQNWTIAGQELQFHFKIRTPGQLHLSLFLKNKLAGNKLSVKIAGKAFLINVPASHTFLQVELGLVQITDTGFYKLTISAIKKTSGSIADIKSLILKGAAAKNIHFNPDLRRNAASVHLFYPVEDSLKVHSFYAEITVPKNADVLQSYYMACGFSRGYFGIQVNSPAERRIIFSVWDAGDEAIDRNKVAVENKVHLIAKGVNVYSNGFGNEGTGGHSHWIYNWTTDITYKFLVTAVTDSATATTKYTGYFFVPELQKWKLIACFKAPKDGKPLKRLYSFVENFKGNNGQLYRKAFFGNQWIRTLRGDWTALTKSRFSYDATGKAGNRIDYGGGTDSNRFYLWNGGFRQSTAAYADVFNRSEINIKPVIDLYKNADSALTTANEIDVILKLIASGKEDTTGSNNGVFYKVLEEGSGDRVTINDTLLVFYKGSLLNGYIFDQTKDKPATFPLKRLIKGWQAGMPFCREGGKIRLIIPSYLGYSIRTAGEIPPNSTLLFDVEVVSIKKGWP